MIQSKIKSSLKVKVFDLSVKHMIQSNLRAKISLFCPVDHCIHPKICLRTFGKPEEEENIV